MNSMPGKVARMPQLLAKSVQWHIGILVAEACRIRTCLTLPNDALSRVQWVLQVLGVVWALVLIPYTIATSTANWPLQAAAVVSLLWLAWLRTLDVPEKGWLRPGWNLLEGVSLLLVGVICGPANALVLLAAGQALRALKFSDRDLLVATLVYAGIYLAAVALSPDNPSYSLVVTEISGLLMLTGILRMSVPVRATAVRPGPHAAPEMADPADPPALWSLPWLKHLTLRLGIGDHTASEPWWVYVALGTLPSAAIVFLPHPARLLLFSLVAAYALLALLLGVILHRPSRPLPWRLFLCGQAALVTAGMATSLSGLGSSSSWVAATIHVSAYPFLIVGLGLLVRSRLLYSDRAGALDTAILTTGAGMLAWVFLISPRIDDVTLSSPQALIAILYPALSVLLLAVSTQLLLAPGAPSTPCRLLRLGLLGILLFDMVHAVALMTGLHLMGGALEAGWAFSHLLLGAAALHPSMSMLTEPEPYRDTPFTRWRLGVLAAPLIISPAILYPGAARGGVLDVAIVSVGSLVLGLLFVVRLVGLVHQLSVTRARLARATVQETALRNADVAISAANSYDDIYAAALVAVEVLLSDHIGIWHAVALTSPEGLTLVAASGSDDRNAEGDTLEVPELMRPALMQNWCVVVPQAGWPSLAGMLSPQLEVVMVAPLIVQSQPRGAILVACGGVPEPEVRVGLQSLGARVALAMESLELTEDRERHQHSERFHLLVQKSSDVITVVDLSGTIRYQSPSVESVLGYGPEELSGSDLRDLIHPEDQARAASFLDEAARSPGSTARVEWRLRHRDGVWLQAETIGNILEAPEGRGIVLNTRDITERKTLEERMAYQAYHDPLTNLPNRALFMDRLEQALAQVPRRVGSVAVLFLDLDRFKIINDSLGHEAGDLLLVTVAERLRSCLRPGDTAARLGGDEFTVLLPEIEAATDAVRVAERITEALQMPVLLGSREVVVTSSIGIVLNSSDHRRPADLLRDVDIAMYQAKHAGRAGYQVFDASMNSEALERLDLEACLRQALERDEFRLHYQPKVELADGTIVGMEALLRWERPSGALTPPETFIPLAEETGLILKIGRWVLRNACYQARLWQDEFPGYSPTVGVNLSIRQFQHPDLVEEVVDALRESGLVPDRLVLEITESVLMEDTESVVGTLQGLKALGVQLAIDDFGRGYSSLNYLKLFPVDSLKVDKTFIDELWQDAADTAIVQAVIGMGHALGLKIVAEGVETTEQLAQLRALRCDQVQGYYFSGPLTGDAASALLAKDHYSSSGTRRLAGRVRQ